MTSKDEIKQELRRAERGVEMSASNSTSEAFYEGKAVALKEILDLLDRAIG